MRQLPVAWRCLEKDRAAVTFQARKLTPHKTFFIEPRTNMSHTVFSQLIYVMLSKGYLEHLGVDFSPDLSEFN